MEPTVAAPGFTSAVRAERCRPSGASYRRMCASSGTVSATFRGKCLTLVHLTKQGRTAWIEYLNRLQALLNAAE